MFKNILAVALLVSAPAFAVEAKKQALAEVKKQAPANAKKVVVLNNQSSIKDLPKKAALYVYDNVVFAANETVEVVRNHKTATAVIVLATLKGAQTEAGRKVTSFFSVDTVKAAFTAAAKRVRALVSKKPLSPISSQGGSSSNGE
jgi:hypothetical protein